MKRCSSQCRVRCEIYNEDSETRSTYFITHQTKEGSMILNQISPTRTITTRSQSLVSRVRLERCLIVILSLICVTRPAIAENRWPGFLGAGHTSLPAGSVPVTWSPTENLAWSIPTPGYGQSSPVIWDNRVFLTSVEGANKETLHVLCFALTTGELLWDYKLESTYPEKNSVYISRAAPTPVVDANGVYAYFESGDVVALSQAGKVRWTVSLKERYGAPQNDFGLAASPVQTEEHVILLIDDQGPSYLTALSKSDGSEAWKTDRTSRKSWSSPMLVPCGDSLQVVCSSDGSVDGYDPFTGKQLWTFKDVGGNTSTTPTIVTDSAVLISASPGRESENAESARKSNGVFVIGREEKEWTPQFAWTNPTASPSWGSPVAYQGFAYWINRVGAVFCLDLKSGQVAYLKRLKQSCWATPVGIGNHLYCFGKDGLTTILATGEDFNVIAENQLWNEENPPVNNLPTVQEESEERRNAAARFSQPTVYGVAIVPGYIVLRTGSQLFCIHTAVVADTDNDSSEIKVALAEPALLLPTPPTSPARTIKTIERALVCIRFTTGQHPRTCHGVAMCCSSLVRNISFILKLRKPNMKSILSLLCTMVLVNSAVAHDTWVEVNTPEVREGNLVYVDLKLGNHGNEHRDFKLHSLITLDHASLSVFAPCGCEADLKASLTGNAYEPKQGYWTARYTTTKPGLHVISHQLDTLHGTIRAIKSAKTYFVVGPDSTATKGPLMHSDRPLGHPLELIPLTNPVTESGPGKPIRVRVLYNKQPLADARVSFIPRGQTLAEGFDDNFERKTDKNGEAEFTPAEANTILVVIHHREPNQSGEGYQSTAYSATLTVAVPEIPFPSIATSK